MNCRFCSNNLFSQLFLRRTDRLKEATSHPISLAEEEVERRHLERSDKEVEEALNEWKQHVHSRVSTFFKTTTMLEEVLVRVARCVNKTDDPVLGSDGQCVYWHGITTDDHQAGIEVVDPKTGAKSVTYVNRVLAYIFADDESFEKLVQLVNKPLKMSCNNQLCVCIAHIAVSG